MQGTAVHVVAEGFKLPVYLSGVRGPLRCLIWCQKAGRSNPSGDRCKPPQHGQRGGDNTHLDGCTLRQYQTHRAEFRLPVWGETLKMIGKARQSGCADLIFSGAGGWINDPNGRPLERSMWMQLTVL